MTSPRQVPEPTDRQWALTREWDNRHTAAERLSDGGHRTHCVACGNTLMVTIDCQFCSFGCAGEPPERVEALWRAKDVTDEWLRVAHCTQCQTRQGVPKRNYYSLSAVRKRCRNMKADNEKWLHAHPYPCPVQRKVWHLTTTPRTPQIPRPGRRA